MNMIVSQICIKLANVQHEKDLSRSLQMEGGKEIEEQVSMPDLLLKKKLKPIQIPTNSKNRPVGYRWSLQKKIENMWEKIDKG